MTESLACDTLGLDASRFSDCRLVTNDHFGTVVDCLDACTDRRSLVRLLKTPLTQVEMDDIKAKVDSEDWLVRWSLVGDSTIVTDLEGYRRVSDLNHAYDDKMVPVAEFEALAIVNAVLHKLLKVEKDRLLMLNLRPTNLYVLPLCQGRPEEGKSSHALKIGEAYMSLLYKRETGELTDVYAGKGYEESFENVLSHSLGSLMYHLVFGEPMTEQHKENNNISYSYSHYMFKLLKFCAKDRLSLAQFERSCRTIVESDALVIYPSARVTNLVTQKGSYSGDIRYGMMHGYGRFESTKDYYTMMEVARYEGFFCLDKMHLKGLVQYRNGDKYQGEIQWDSPKGFGTLTRVTGTRLTGVWEGSYLSEEHEAEIVIPGYSAYTGLTAKNQPHGRGKIVYHDGYIYEGGFKQNQRHGKGTMVREDDGKEVYKYSGDWHENEKHGSGTETVPGQTEFTGAFHLGLKQGQGKVRNLTEGWEYEGEFRSDKMHGFGQIEHNNGYRYNGEFKFGMKQGFGCCGNPDGSTYEGQWERDKPHGEGTFTDAEGNLVTGVWVDGERVEYED